METSWEQLSESIYACITGNHRFGTDAFLLSHFAAPRRKDQVCDLGTGCGIIPLLLCRDYSPRRIDALDIQQEAVDCLQAAIQKSRLQDVVFPHLADLRKFAPEHSGMFDVVTCNPPYKANGAGILSSTSSDRIARHETLCTTEDVCKTAARLLKHGGRLCLCQRPERLADVLCAMRVYHIEPKRLRLVSKNPGSAPWLFLVEGKKGSRPFLQVEAPLAVYDNGRFSTEMGKIYGWGKEDV